MSFIDDILKEDDYKKSVEHQLGISKERLKELEIIAKDRLSGQRTVAECLQLIDSCDQYHGVEKTFVAYRWTMGYAGHIGNKLAKKFLPFIQDDEK